MRYGIIPGRTAPRRRKRDWAAKHDLGNPKAVHELDRDNKVNRVESRFAPELIQAAKALGMHPAQLEEKLRVHRGMLRLAAKFNR